MSRARLVLLFVLLCVADTAAILFSSRPVSLPKPDLAAINEVVQEVTLNGLNTPAPNAIQYAVLNEHEDLLYSTGPDASTSLHDAAAQGDLILPVHAENGILYYILFQSETEAMVQDMAEKQRISLWICTGIQLGALGCILLYVDRRILCPYRALERTAARIARGQFDVPLAYDRGGTFGAFTESIDLLRTELAREQTARRKASDDMKQLISDLSHDIRTPVASILAAAELGELRAATGKDTAAWHAVLEKGRQMQTLASNLLNAALQEENALSVLVRPMSSQTIQGLLSDADPDAVIEPLPACTVLADPVRFSQIAANISSNAAKYGKPPLTIQGIIRDGMLLLIFEDTGNGAQEEELPVLRLRGARGKSAEGIDGAGLGLYICDQLLAAMDGQLLIQNGPKGLRVTVALPLKENLGFAKGY